METIDTSVLRGRVKIRQPVAGGLRVTMDSVFCAAACPAQPGERVCDLGAGTGVVGLCVAARVPGIALNFVEIQADYADLALENAALNDVSAITFASDVRDFRAENLFHHVVMNPPYLDEANHWASPDAARSKALGVWQGDAPLIEWVACAARNLKDRGSVTIVHRADALDAILSALHERHFGAVEIWPMQPYVDKDATRIVVRARLNRKTKLILHAPIILHTEVEKYSAMADVYLSEMRAL